MTNMSMSIAQAKSNFAAALKMAAKGGELIDLAVAQQALYQIARSYQGIDAKMYSVLAVNYFAANQKALSLCSPSSLLGAFMQLCSIGLPLRTAQPLVYLVPYKDNCTIQIGADGWQALAKRNFPSLVIRTEFVTKSELANFSIEKKEGKVVINHKFDPLRSDADAVTMYATVSLDGNQIVDVKIMTKADADKLKALHKGNIWNVWAGAMWATKLTKKVAKSLAAIDPDGICAIADMSNDSVEPDVELVYDEISIDELQDSIEERASCSNTIEELGVLYKKVEAELTALGLSVTPFVPIFSKRANAINGK